MQRQMRNMERAAQCYASALQLRPSFPEALNNMSVIYTSQACSSMHDAHGISVSSIMALGNCASAPAPKGQDQASTCIRLTDMIARPNEQTLSFTCSA